MKTRNQYIIICILFLFIQKNAEAQPTSVLSLEKEISIERPVKVSTDRAGFIYYADQKGEVHKLDDSGKQVSVFSPDQPGNISLLEAWSNLRMLIFYEDFQEYLFLDRFLRASPNYRVEANKTGYASIMTNSEENQLWIIDGQNLNLIKFDYNTQVVVLNSSLKNYILSQDYDLNYIRAYQHLLFINDATDGILVFDNFGNYLKKLPITGLNYFNFIEDEIYYLKDNKITFLHLYNFNERIIETDETKGYEFALATSKKVYLFSASSLDIYSYK